VYERFAVSNDLLLSPRDAGKRLGVSTARVIQLARDGRLRELRDSAGRRLFRPADVEQCRRAREAAKRGQHEE
jgi:predicted site-specific integrase-resolvase